MSNRTFIVGIGLQHNIGLGGAAVVSVYRRPA
jgi:hypothetical protein